MREAHAVEVEGEGVAEAGFTLIELMVVLLIIAILLAIAIPTFLGVTTSAHDRAVQSNLTNANTEVQAQYQNGQSYAFAAAAQTPVQNTLNTSAPEFQWVDGGTASIDQNHMSIGVFDVNSVGDTQGMVIAALNKTTGTCWYAMNLQANPATGVPPTGVTATRAGTYYANQTSQAGKPCSAGNATGTAGWKWGTSYSDSAGSNG
jgi:type IV pilus assembly protein PilA